MRVLKFALGLGIVVVVAVIAGGPGSNDRSAYGFIPASDGECVKIDSPTFAMGVPPEYKGPSWPASAEGALVQAVGSQKAASMEKKEIDAKHVVFELTEGGKVIEYVDVQKTELGWAVHERGTKVACPS